MEDQRSFLVLMIRNAVAFCAFAGHFMEMYGGAGHVASGQIGLARAEPAGYYQVIYDATEPVSADYQTDFGYAVYIQFDGKKVLLDTGVTPDILARNMGAAGIDPAQLDLVAITHNHPDHAGGLGYLRRSAAHVPVYAPPQQRLDGGAVQRLEDYLQVTPNLYLLRTHTDTPTVGIGDELSLLIKTAQGPYLITGCSHPLSLEALLRWRPMSG